MLCNISLVKVNAVFSTLLSFLDNFREWIIYVNLAAVVTILKIKTTLVCWQITFGLMFLFLVLSVLLRTNIEVVFVDYRSIKIKFLQCVQQLQLLTDTILQVQIY
jgi:hypothetical protein